MKKTIILLSILFLTSCATELSIKTEINKANFCTTKEDCVNVGSKCPFGCYILVNKKHADEIKTKVDAFNSKCMYSCIQCDDFACIDNKCQPVCDGPIAQ